MKTLHINDEVYERLKAFVVDPFDDTPNAILMRLIDIASKAQNHWRPFTPPQPAQAEHLNGSIPSGKRIPDSVSEGTPVTPPQPVQMERYDSSVPPGTRIPDSVEDTSVVL